MKTQDSGWPGRDLNRLPPECNCTATPTLLVGAQTLEMYRVILHTRVIV